MLAEHLCQEHELASRTEEAIDEHAARLTKKYSATQKNSQLRKACRAAFIMPTCGMGCLARASIG